MLNIMASFAQFEKGLIGERVRAGMERARRQGQRLGRPGGTRRDGFLGQWAVLRPRVLAGEVSKKQAARTLGVSKSTILRLLRAVGQAKGLTVSPWPSERNSGPERGSKTLSTCCPVDRDK
jgi:DNA invertase Pin-like site-specific DNA recombinase